LLNQFGTPIVLPITRTPRGYATHVELDAVLPATGHVQCELIRALAASRVSRRLATAPPEVMAQVRLTLRRILGL
jgi:mRNA interferase MazF